jgi:two-component system KDP operon response regulator KdpE
MEEPTKILVVDDDTFLLRFVRANLESAGYQVLLALEADPALELMEREQPDLAILDIMLPGMDGFELCQRIREFADVPILMLTARVEERDKVKGLRLGADDYVTKPFSAQELLARVEALLRRTRSEETAAPSSFSHEGLTIDYVRRRVVANGHEVNLTPTEYKLLHQMATNAGKVMLHEELLTNVWGAEYRSEIDYLRAYIRRLRQKIEENPHSPKYLLSRPGIGYMLAGTP